MHWILAGIQGRDSVTVVTRARFESGILEIKSAPARTDLSCAELHPRIERISGRPPLITRDAAAMNRGIAETFIVLARTEGCAAGIAPVPQAFAALRNECMAVPSRLDAVRRECIPVVGQCIRVPPEFVRLELESIGTPPE